MNWKKLGKSFVIAAGIGGATLIVASNAEKKAAAGGCADKGCSVNHGAAAKPAKPATDLWKFLPDVVASIGSEKITKAQFIKEVSPMIPKGAGANISAEQLKLAAPKLVEGLVDKTILLNLAKKDGVVPSPKQVLGEFDKTFGKLPEEERKRFEMMLKMQNMSMDDYKKKISTDVMAQEGMAISQWVAEYVAKKIAISDKEVKEYYDKNLKFFKQPEKVAASHILIKPKDKTEAADKEAKKKAEGILAKITKGAESFEKLAEAESACPSGKSAKGSLGEFGRGQMVPEFEKAAFSLEPNKVSDLVKTQFGYHIIKVTGKKAAATKPFADVKAQIKEQLNAQQIEKTLKDIIAKEKERLKVKINV